MIFVEMTITEHALEKINEKMTGKEGHLKLKYVTEGCGCVMSGVPTLWFVDQVEDDDIAVDTNDMTVWMEKTKLVFFDDVLKIDYSDQAQTFQLKTPNQMLNGRMAFQIR